MIQNRLAIIRLTISGYWNVRTRNAGCAENWQWGELLGIEDGRRFLFSFKRGTIFLLDSVLLSPKLFNKFHFKKLLDLYHNYIIYFRKWTNFSLTDIYDCVSAIMFMFTCSKWIRNYKINCSRLEVISVARIMNLIKKLCIQVKVKICIIGQSHDCYNILNGSTKEKN